MVVSPSGQPQFAQFGAPVPQLEAPLTPELQIVKEEQTKWAKYVKFFAFLLLAFGMIDFTLKIVGMVVHNHGHALSLVGPLIFMITGALGVKAAKKQTLKSTRRYFKCMAVVAVAFLVFALVGMIMMDAHVVSHVGKSNSHGKKHGGKHDMDKHGKKDWDKKDWDKKDWDKKDWDKKDWDKEDWDKKDWHKKDKKDWHKKDWDKKDWDKKDWDKKEKDWDKKDWDKKDWDKKDWHKKDWEKKDWDREDNREHGKHHEPKFNGPIFEALQMEVESEVSFYAN